MPRLSPLGVARQTTLMAKRTQDAVVEAKLLDGAAQAERIRDARTFANETGLWLEYATRQGWRTVVRHAMAQVAIAIAALEELPQ